MANRVEFDRNDRFVMFGATRMQPTVLIAGILALALLLSILAALWERRLVWPFSEPRGFDPLPEEHLTPLNRNYVRMRLQQLQAAGFHLVAHCYDAKGPRHSASYLFALSEDQHTLAMIRYASGFSFPLSGMWLISKNSGGRHYFTVDSPLQIEYDVSGNSEFQVHASASFKQIYAAHEQWIRSRALPYLFAAQNPVQEYRAFLLHRCLMRRILGLAYYVDNRRTSWRYTFRGALRYTFGGMINAVFRP